MWIFKKRKTQQNEREAHEKAVTIEIQNHKKTTLKAIKETKQVTDNFNRLLKKNGITLKIHIATTGGHK